MAWSLIATESVTDAAQRASPEQTRSLHVLLSEMASQIDPGPWQSVTASLYFGFSEASGNRVYDSLVYELWQTLALPGGQWDLAAKMWPVRRWAEQSLGAVVAGIADAEPDRARAAMEHHLRSAASMINAEVCPASHGKGWRGRRPERR